MAHKTIFTFTAISTTTARHRYFTVAAPDIFKSFWHAKRKLARFEMLSRSFGPTHLSGPAIDDCNGLVCALPTMHPAMNSATRNF